MARNRLRAAARKVGVGRSEEIAFGVLAVAREVSPHLDPGALYWVAPFTYVAEQMAPRVCAAHDVPPAQAEDVAAYLLAALNEYVVALVGEFDIEHYEAWTAAAALRDG